MGENMSLSQEQKAHLLKGVSRLTKTLNSLVDAPVDPAVLDLIDTAIGLLERQIDMNIEFIMEGGALELSEEGNSFLFLQEDGGEEDYSANLFSPVDEDEPLEFVYDDELDNFDIDFELPEEEDDSPSAEDLQRWFNLPFPE